MFNWKTVLCSVAICILSIFAIVPKTTCAEEIIHNHFYEFPFTGELYAESGDGVGEYYDINMSCGIDINTEGKVTYTLYAQEDYSGKMTTMNTPSFSIKYNIPSWYLWLNNDPLYDEPIGIGVSLNDDDFPKKEKFQYYNFRYNNEKRSLNPFGTFYWQWIYPDKLFEIKKGEIIGRCSLHPRTTVYTDESGNMFVRNNDGSKNYFSDTVEITINDMTVSKKIGNSQDESDIIIYRQGDVNGDSLFNISDVVLLQKWLLVSTKELSCWQAADLCKDNQLDVFDLCLMKRKLIETEHEIS